MLHAWIFKDFILWAKLTSFFFLIFFLNSVHPRKLLRFQQRYLGLRPHNQSRTWLVYVSHAEIHLFTKFTGGGGIIYSTLLNGVRMALSEGPCRRGSAVVKAEGIDANAVGATVPCDLLGRIHPAHRNFRFGYGFSLTNCNIRSWGHSERNGSDLMRLMPNSVISTRAKSGSSPGRQAARSGAQDAEVLTQMLPWPLHLSPSGGSNLILQKWNIEKYCHCSPLPTCSSICMCTLSKMHFWPYRASANVKSLAGRILPRTWPFPAESGFNILPTPGAAPWCPTAPCSATAFQEVSATGGEDLHHWFRWNFSFQRQVWNVGTGLGELSELPDQLTRICHEVHGR